MDLCIWRTNRKLFFQKEKGFNIDDIFDNCKCSEGRFKICIINRENREMLYNEIGPMMEYFTYLLTNCEKIVKDISI